MQLCKITESWDNSAPQEPSQFNFDDVLVRVELRGTWDGLNSPPMIITLTPTYSNLLDYSNSTGSSSTPSTPAVVASASQKKAPDTFFPTSKHKTDRPSIDSPIEIVVSNVPKLVLIPPKLSLPPIVILFPGENLCPL